MQSASGEFLNSNSSEIVDLFINIDRAFSSSCIVAIDEVLGSRTCRCYECVAIMEALGGKRWTEMSKATLNGLHDCFPLLGAAAMHCFLPAFMKASYSDCELADNISYNIVNYFLLANYVYLSPTELPPIGDEFDGAPSRADEKPLRRNLSVNEEVIALFTQPQRETLTRYFEFYLKNIADEMDKADVMAVLGQAWLRFDR